MKMMVFRAASRMRTRKGLLALKVTLFRFSERPAMTTAVLAAASLPSSFTCRAHGHVTGCYRQGKHAQAQLRLLWIF